MRIFSLPFLTAPYAENTPEPEPEDDSFLKVCEGFFLPFSGLGQIFFDNSFFVRLNLFFIKSILRVSRKKF